MYETEKENKDEKKKNGSKTYFTSLISVKKNRNKLNKISNQMK